MELWVLAQARVLAQVLAQVLARVLAQVLAQARVQVQRFRCLCHLLHFSLAGPQGRYNQQT